MKSAIFFVLLAFVYLVQSSSEADSSSNPNLIETDLLSKKNARIVNQPSNEVIELQDTPLQPPNPTVLKLMTQSIFPMILSLLVKSKVAVAQLVFGVFFGIIGTFAACTYTPFCRIMVGWNAFPEERIKELTSPSNLEMLSELWKNMMSTYEAAQTMNSST